MGLKKDSASCVSQLPLRKRARTLGYVRFWEANSSLTKSSFMDGACIHEGMP
jgi:hypothetical protein